MSRKLQMTGRALALLASMSLVGSPALAAAGARPAAPAAASPAAASWSPADETADNHRRWRGHRHRGGIDGGDLVGGLLILGGIAAVAGAIDRSGDEARERRYPYPEQRYEPRDGAYYDEWDDRDPAGRGEWSARGGDDEGPVAEIGIDEDDRGYDDRDYDVAGVGDYDDRSRR